MSARSIISVTGEDRVRFLQAIVTQDVAKLNEDKIQFAALLTSQGKILHDMFLIDGDNSIFIDTQTAYADLLLKRLSLYKLRAKVTLAMADAPALTLPDPRHPALPPRDYTGDPDNQTQARALGIPELGVDFAPDAVVALDAGYDLLHAISFTKGCYVGQEVTARMHYKNIARRGFYVLQNDTLPPRLALLKFEEVEAAHGNITVDNQPYRATLPGWMGPKFAQFKTLSEKQ